MAMVDDPYTSNTFEQNAALLAVHEAGSFVGAGRLLVRHPTVISRRIARLEARLGVRLIERSTRQARFTEAGLRYVVKLQEARALLAEAEAEAQAAASEIRGQLRLAIPAALGRRWLAPLIAEFLAEHPGISIHTDYADHYVDLVNEGFDAAIRVGEMPDSRIKASRLCDNVRILCAAPAYLERAPALREPAHLAQHNCLVFTGLASYPQWRLHHRNGTVENVVVRGTLSSNDNEALLAAAVRGAGVMAGGEWLFSQDIAAGRLVRVLPQWQLDARSAIYFVRPSCRYAPAKTQAFKRWIKARLAPVPPWSRP
ncbi:LysR family transcriptional regulator [Pseudomonadota bacterium AL_CKDN230030165-1A_HGKHYDSX7]